jgi:large subunit ribosomal protein L25
MRIGFELSAEPRADQGKGASRRLRQTGLVPAVLYGGHAEARALSLNHNKLMGLIGNEKFYCTIISVNVGSEKAPAIVKDVQMHPAKHAVLHVDLQRVLENEKVRLHLPLHFMGDSVCPGVKTQGGVVSHLLPDVEVTCLPKDLPEFLEIDMSAMNLNDTLFLSDVKVPAGVTISALAHGRNSPVVSVHAPRAAEPEPEVAAEAAATAEGAVTPAAGEAAKAGDAKAGDAKAGDAKAADAKAGDAKAAAPKKDAGKK